MERHRAQLADAAIEEQIEVQTAFREQGQRLQRIYDHRCVEGHWGVWAPGEGEGFIDIEGALHVARG